MQLDEPHLAQSIAAAFDRLPEPEAARLEALERRLARSLARSTSRKGSRARFWWLMAGLVATGAAAWWGGEHWRSAALKPELRAPASTAVGETERDAKPLSREEHKAEPSNKKSSESNANSPTIYQREAY